MTRKCAWTCWNPRPSRRSQPSKTNWRSRTRSGCRAFWTLAGSMCCWTLLTSSGADASRTCRRHWSCWSASRASPNWSTPRVGSPSWSPMAVIPKSWSRVRQVCFFSCQTRIPYIYTYSWVDEVAYQGIDWDWKCKSDSCINTCICKRNILTYTLLSNNGNCIACSFYRITKCLYIAAHI